MYTPGGRNSTQAGGRAVPLRYLFVDMNSYFASVEQQDKPELRGKPVAVVAVDAETTSCLAASYEAKKHGVKTGTPVWRARQMCRGLVCLPARPHRYVELHEQIVKAVGRCVPVEKVLSVDEMACKLLGDEREPAKATAIGKAIKREILRGVGEALFCSVGVAPNGLLAKMAGDMQKPDGLTLLHSEELPHGLFHLKLIDFPGIGPRMERRLNVYNVFTVEQLYGLSVKQLSLVWGSKVHGERWFHQIRGDEVYEKPTVRRTVGQSHVLAPDLRTDSGAKGVFSRLIHKAAGRLRDIDYWAGHLAVGVSYMGHQRWEAGTALLPCQDTLTMLEAFAALWERRPPDLTPVKVDMVLTRLSPARAATPSLFEEDRGRNALSHAMDAANKTFGRNSVYFGSLFGSEDTAPMRIPFQAIPEDNPAYQ
jgi:DNA polymerase-4